MAAPDDAQNTDRPTRVAPVEPTDGGPWPGPREKVWVGDVATRAEEYSAKGVANATADEARYFQNALKAQAAAWDAYQAIVAANRAEGLPWAMNGGQAARDRWLSAGQSVKAADPFAPGFWRRRRD